MTATRPRDEPPPSLPPLEGPDPVSPAYRSTPAFAAGMRFAAFLVLFAGSDVTPRSRAERERLAAYLERAASAEWR